MKIAIFRSLTFSLLSICAISSKATASDEKGTALISSITLMLPAATIDASKGSTKASNQSSDESAAGQSGESSQTGNQNRPSQSSSKVISNGVSDNSREDSRATSASSGKRYVARKLIVPFRARTEAAALLADRSPSPPSALLRSILNELRGRQVAMGGGASSDRELAAQLVALPLDQS